MHPVLRHLALASRKLRRAPVFTATAVITLGIGIGANAAIFSVVNSVILKPLPFDNPGSLVAMWHEAPGLGFDILSQSPATYLTYRADSRVLDDVAMWNESGAQVLVGSEPEQVETLMVTDGFLPLLGVDATVGRRFTAADDAPDAPATAMLTHAYWQRTFGGDPATVGQSLIVYGEPVEIIGVLPEGFQFLDSDPAFLYPGQFDPAEVIMGNFSYQAVARMAAGVTIDQVAAEVERLLPVAVDRYPGPVTQEMLDQAQMAPIIRPLKEDMVGDVRSVLWVLLGTVGMVLLIAVANVANLFLVRAEGRNKDVALRTAMGANRTDIAGQFLTESLLLGLLGGVAGLSLAWVGLRLLVAMAPAQIPRLDEIGIDPLVLAFTAAISIGAGIVFGLFPLVRYSRPDMVTALKESGRGGSQGRQRHRARNVLVVGQVAMALVLVVGAGLMIRSFQALKNVDPGFDTSPALTFRVTVPSAVASDVDETVALWRQMVDNLQSVPGVTAVGSATAIPLGGWDSNDPVFVEDSPVTEGQLPPIRRFNFVMPGYFEAMGIELLAGRDLNWVDIDERRPSVIVSENFAREYWASPQEALGRRVATLNIENGEMVWKEIVGVVDAVQEDGFDQDATSAMYWPLAQDDMYGVGPEVRRSMAFVVRTQPGAMSGLLAQVRQAVAGVTASVPVAQPRTMEELVDRSMARTAFALVMLGIAGAVALLLGAIGIYGVVSYAVSQRTREIGVRMALGAKRGDVSGMVVRQGMTLAGIGVGVGLLAAVGLTRLMASLLYGVDPIDLPTFGGVALALTAVAMLASWLPAHRAATVDPAVTLREE
jgi:predicted permease